ncbi:hypothetical protein E2C01_012762 [Portunus trituberculatus]|uniref:Uncharacterized protein n=1 Tax=Portunus trituberculatus TaxID=210409 RepID=A0A5B7DEG4_PORTR|nr:hypothetical protein [Portunus trituberculatus]
MNRTTPYESRKPAGQPRPALPRSALPQGRHSRLSHGKVNPRPRPRRGPSCRRAHNLARHVSSANNTRLNQKPYEFRQSGRPR